MADVLMLCQRIPFPPDKGEKIRSFRILERLTRGHRVHLGCLIDDPADLAHVEAVRARVAGLHVAVIDRRRARLTAAVRALATGQGLSVAYFADPALRRWVRRTLETVRPEAVVINSSNMAPYLLDGAGPRPARLIADVVDVDSAKFEHYAEEASVPMRWLFRREARLVAALEARLVAAADHATLVSEPEAALLRARLDPALGDRIQAVTNGVDVTFFSPDNAGASPYHRAGGPVFCLAGHMDYRPNIDAARWFAEAVLPCLRERVPEARFAVVGANPAREVTELAGRPGVIVTGRVPDVRPYVGHAAVSVAPLRIARGIQNKLLEAMALARPVVATSAALTGIAARPGEHLLCTDAAETFAEACADALSAGYGAALGAAARRFVVERHAWERTLSPLDAMLAPAEGAASAPRSAATA